MDFQTHFMQIQMNNATLNPDMLKTETYQKAKYFI